MTQSVAHLFRQLEELPKREQAEFRDLFLLRHEDDVEACYVGDDLTDDDFSAIAAETFRALDEEENAAPAK